MNGNLAYQQNDLWVEIIDGKVTAMSPRPTTDHNFVASNIFYLLAHYLKGKRCTPFADGTDLYLSEKDHFIPDGMVVCDTEKIKRDGVHGAPDLVVEVLSPSTAKHDRGRKKQVYEQCGVSEYWIVDPANKTLEQYLLQQGAFTLHEVYAIYPDYMLDKMTEEERAALPASFRCSLFEDLDIVLEDIFDRVL